MRKQSCIKSIKRDQLIWLLLALQDQFLHLFFWFWKQDCWRLRKLDAEIKLLEYIPASYWSHCESNRNHTCIAFCFILVFQGCLLLQGLACMLKMETCIKRPEASQCDSHAEGGLLWAGGTGACERKCVLGKWSRVSQRSLPVLKLRLGPGWALGLFRRGVEVQGECVQGMKG